MFLSIYLISTTEFSQLLKFPVLVEHYFEHKEQTPDMSVIDFLVLHYGGNHLENHPQNDDFDRDQQLPFMMHDNVLSFVFISPQPQYFKIENKANTYQPLEISSFDDLFISNQTLSSIWRPPKNQFSI